MHYIIMAAPTLTNARGEKSLKELQNFLKPTNIKSENSSLSMFFIFIIFAKKLAP